MVMTCCDVEKKCFTRMHNSSHTHFFLLQKKDKVAMHSLPMCMCMVHDMPCQEKKEEI